MIAREQGVPRPKVSGFWPRHNIIRPKLCNNPRAELWVDYTIRIMLRSCVRARWKESASTLSVEAATVSSVAQGRRTPPARRFLSFFQDSTLRALLPVLKEAARP